MDGPSWILQDPNLNRATRGPRPPFMRGYSIIPWERRAPTAARGLAAAGPTGVSLRTIPWPKSLSTRGAPNLGGIHWQGPPDNFRFANSPCNSRSKSSCHGILKAASFGCRSRRTAGCWSNILVMAYFCAMCDMQLDSPREFKKHRCLDHEVETRQ